MNLNILWPASSFIIHPLQRRGNTTFKQIQIQYKIPSLFLLKEFTLGIQIICSISWVIYNGYEISTSVLTLVWFAYNKHSSLLKTETLARTQDGVTAVDVHRHPGLNLQINYLHGWASSPPLENMRFQHSSGSREGRWWADLWVGKELAEIPGETTFGCKCVQGIIVEKQRMAWGSD